MAVRYCDKSNGKGQLHNISRHAGPKVQSETDKPNPQPQTATARHEQLRRDERIGNHALKNPCQLIVDDIPTVEAAGRRTYLFSVV
jgi:hypothetical protein